MSEDLTLNQFPVTSRYHGIGTEEYITDEGRVIVHLKRRFIPQKERFEVMQEHIVAPVDRLDNVTAKYLGDPEQFWRLCDANGAMIPDELTSEAGRFLIIPSPDGG